MDVVLQAEGLTLRYAGRKALDSISLSVTQGATCAVVGDTGAGKTTLLRILTGLIRADGGSFSVFGEPGLRSQRLGRVGALVDAPAWYPELSVRQNVQAQAGLIDKVDRERVRRLTELLSLSPRVTGRGAMRNMSAGVKQNFALACAYMGKPDLVLLDEPFAGLDADTGSAFDGLLAEEAARGVTTLITGAFVSELWQAATHFVLLERGKVVCTAPKQAFEELLGPGTPDEKEFRAVGQRLGEGSV